MKFHTYILTLSRTGVIYIGSTSNIKKRFDRHLNDLSHYKHHNAILQKNWSGNEEVLMNAFECDTRQLAYDLEQELIEKVWNSKRQHLLCNIGTSVIGGDNLSRNPNKEDIVQRMTATNKVRFETMTSDERKTAYGSPGELNPMYGKNHSEETRRLMSVKAKGHSRNKGCKLSEQHIEQIRVRQRLRVREKNSFYGKKHSEEMKKLSSERMKGKIPGNVRKIAADGFEFLSCAAASRYFNISQGLVTHRLKSSNYPLWYYKDEASDA
jgi:group I intron endonuclease